jgi:ABC-2 type transport system permease protein
MTDAASAAAPVRRNVRRPGVAEAQIFATLALFQASVARYLFARRAVVVGLLLLAPAAFVALIRVSVIDRNEPRFFEGAELAMLLTVGPTAIVSFVCLLLSVGLIQDEIEEQTLTYVLLRPVPRWAIYFAKWLAAAAIAVGFTALFQMVGYAALYAGSDGLTTALTTRAWKAAGAVALAAFAYCGAFGLLGMLFKRSLVFGIVYIILFEGVLAAIPFNFRMYTIAYHFRMLCMHWIGVGESEWGLTPPEAQTAASTSVLTLLGAGVALTFVASWIASRREFRMKTPAAA